MWRVCLWVEYSCEWMSGVENLPVSGVFLWVKVWRVCLWVKVWRVCLWVKVWRVCLWFKVWRVCLWVMVWRVCLWVQVWRVCLWVKVWRVCLWVKVWRVCLWLKSVHVSGGVESVSVSKNQSANCSVRGGLLAALRFIHLKHFWCLVLGLPWWVAVYSCRRSSLAFGHILPTDLWGGGGWREGFGDGLRNLVRM